MTAPTLAPEAQGLLRIYEEARRAASRPAADDIERTALRVLAREAAVELADHLAAELADHLAAEEPTQ